MSTIYRCIVQGGHLCHVDVKKTRTFFDQILQIGTSFATSGIMNRFIHLQIDNIEIKVDLKESFEDSRARIDACKVQWGHILVLIALFGD